MDTNYEKAISFDSIYNSFQSARAGSFWKDSVIGYDINRLINSTVISRELQSGTYRLKGYYHFDVLEREKVRHIQSLHITDRVFQRSLCEEVLKPRMLPTFIYDNGASQRHKGTNFSKNRLKTHLHQYYRNFGTEGYILQIDIKKYFDSISHRCLKKRVDKHFPDDERTRCTLYEIIDSFGDVGLGLGSQVCQILALDYLSPLDHFIKEILHIKYFGRYMDDMYLIHPDKEYLNKCKRMISDFLKEYELEIHPHKTQIYPIKRGIRFLGFHFYLTDTGKVYVKILKKSVKRIKRKLRNMVNKGISEDTILRSFSCWRGHALYGNNYYTVKRVQGYLENLLENRRKLNEQREKVI